MNPGKEEKLNMSHENFPLTFHYNWLVNRDPYNGVFIIIPKYNPLYNLTNQGFVHCSHVDLPEHGEALGLILSSLGHLGCDTFLGNQHRLMSVKPTVC